MSQQPGRNDPCPCGSGRKYKKCCAEKSAVRQSVPQVELGQLVALFQAGRYVEVESRARAVLERQPDSGMVWKLLGTALGVQGKNALHALQQAVQLLPQDVEVHNNLGNALKDLGQLQDATASYRRAIALNSQYADAHNNLGLVLNALGQHEAAAASYRRALALKPDDVEMHVNLGIALNAGDQFGAAVTCYRRALALNPNCAEAYNSLGNSLQALGQLGEAMMSYRRALELKPNYALAHNNLGSAQKSCGQIIEALASYRRALALKPEYADAHYNLGNALQDLGQLDAALASYRSALVLKPDYSDARGNILFTLNFTAGHSPSSCLEEARQYGRMVARQVERFSAWQCKAAPERLRVGLVSGDLRNHPVAFFLESVLEQIDASQIELIAYPTSRRVDEVSARLQHHFAAWKPIHQMPDADAARMIHANGVHILLDLSGHTAHDRLPLFAWKPAPVQASWLGYFATTGVAEIDYLLADLVGVPEDQREQFTEAVWYLPVTRLCFTAPKYDLPVASLPALASGHITFGCCQNLAKLGDAVLATWGKLFGALPSARLRLASKQLGDAAVAAQFMQRLQQHGIDAARVELRGSVTRAAYLAAHAEVDVMLDTFPYPGGTTTCEALWMGVPTLTLAGETLLARQGASLLTAAGLSDWVANSEDEYIAKAIQLTSDLHKLAALRAGLRQQVLASPLFDAPRFARNFEAALWGMWREKGLEILKSEPT